MYLFHQANNQHWIDGQHTVFLFSLSLSIFSAYIYIYEYEYKYESWYL